MADQESLSARCRERVATLSRHHGWELSDEQIERYVAQIVQHVPARSLERQMDLVVGFYHTDHQRVADLHTPTSAGYNDAWDWVANEIARVAKMNGLSWSRDPIVELSDLVQTVQVEVLRSLPGYRFESRLSTWLHGVTVRRLRRLHRDNAAAKRAVRPEALEAAIGRPSELGQDEQMLSARMLADEIKRVLAVTGDKRYATIFLLREVGDLSSEEIAAQFRLHPSRIRALLKTARELLCLDASMRDWEADAS